MEREGKGCNIDIFLVVGRSHQVHQRLDEKADRISGGLDDLNRPLMRAVSQVHAIDLDYSIPDLKVNEEKGAGPFIKSIFCLFFFFFFFFLIYAIPFLQL